MSSFKAIAIVALAGVAAGGVVAAEAHDVNRSATYQDGHSETIGATVANMGRWHQGSYSMGAMHTGMMGARMRSTAYDQTDMQGWQKPMMSRRGNMMNGGQEHSSMWSWMGHLGNWHWN